MDPEYRWAHESASRLVEAHRDDPLLAGFYREIVAHEQVEMDFIRSGYMERELES